MSVAAVALLPMMIALLSGAFAGEVEENTERAEPDDASPDTDRGGVGADHLIGLAGEDDVLSGMRGNDILEGNAGDEDVLYGGAGSDAISITASNSATGGEGLDSFHVDATGGPSRITDFDPEQDSLSLTVSSDIDGLHLATDGADGMNITNENGDTLLALEGVTTLEGADVFVKLAETEDGPPVLSMSLADLALGDEIHLNYDASDGWQIDPSNSGAEVTILAGDGAVVENGLESAVSVELSAETAMNPTVETLGLTALDQALR